MIWKEFITLLPIPELLKKQTKYLLFVDFVDGSTGGTHWTCFHARDHKSCFLSVLEAFPISSCFNIYQDQPLFIILKFKVQLVIYMQHIV